MALERKISPDVFWQSSVLEIIDMIDAYERRRKEDIRREIDIQFALAEAISSRIAYLFCDEKKRRTSDILQPWTAYPELFEDRSAEIEEQARAQQTATFKNNMTAFAERWNKRKNHGDNASI